MTFSRTVQRLIFVGLQLLKNQAADSSAAQRCWKQVGLFRFSAL